MLTILENENDFKRWVENNPEHSEDMEGAHPFGFPCEVHVIDGEAMFTYLQAGTPTAPAAPAACPPPMPPAPVNKYQRVIRNRTTKQCTTVDVYDVLVAFGIECPALAHAVKKCLAAGKRGHKDSATDKREAIASLLASIELDEVRT